MSCFRNALSIVLIAAIGLMAEDIRSITPGEKYYLKGLGSDDLVIVTSVDRDGNRVKVRKQDGIVDWVSPSDLASLSESRERDGVRVGIGALLLGALICGATDACKDTTSTTLSNSVSSPRDLRVCNKSTVGTAYVAVTYEKNGNWTTVGWYGIEQGSCALVASGITSGKIYYSAHDSQGGTWGKGQEMCVDPTNRFSIPYTKSCSGPYRLQSFSEKQVNASGQTLVNLVD